LWTFEAFAKFLRTSTMGGERTLAKYQGASVFSEMMTFDGVDQ